MQVKGITDLWYWYAVQVKKWGIKALIWATFNSWFIKLYNIPKNKYICHDTVSNIGDTIRIIFTCLIKQYIDWMWEKKWSRLKLKDFFIFIFFWKKDYWFFFLLPKLNVRTITLYAPLHYIMDLPVSLKFIFNLRS